MDKIHGEEIVLTVIAGICFAVGVSTALCCLTATPIRNPALALFAGLDMFWSAAYFIRKLSEFAER